MKISLTLLKRSSYKTFVQYNAERALRLLMNAYFGDIFRTFNFTKMGFLNMF